MIDRVVLRVRVEAGLVGKDMGIASHDIESDEQSCGGKTCEWWQTRTQVLECFWPQNIGYPSSKADVVDEGKYVIEAKVDH